VPFLAWRNRHAIASQRLLSASGHADIDRAQSAATSDARFQRFNPARMLSRAFRNKKGLLAQAFSLVS